MTTKVSDEYVSTELTVIDPKRTPNFENSQRSQFRYLPLEKCTTKLVIDGI